MANVVKLRPDGIVEIDVIGNQTVESIMQMGKETLKLLEYQKSLGKPQLVLDDITRLGSTGIAARKAVTDLANQLPYERAALLGDGSLLMRVGSNLMLRAIFKTRSVRYFEDRGKATKWLLNRQ